LIFGLGLLWLANYLEGKNFLEIYVSITRDLASLAIGSMVLSFVWELYSKGAFMRELEYTNQISYDVGQAGLISVKEKWGNLIDWTKEFKETDNFFVFFIYGDTWVKSNYDALLDYAKRRGTKATFVFPQPKNTELMKMIGYRLANSEARPTPSEIRKKIENSTKEILSIYKKVDNPTARLKIMYVNSLPVYSYYEMDTLAIVAFYKHKRRRDDVPHMKLSKSGTLFKYFSNDIHEMMKDKFSEVEIMYPEQKQ
jgi:hypothetical protein